MEGTNISEGRGTPHPFKRIGAPWIDGEKLSQTLKRVNLPGVTIKPVTFKPVEISNMAIKPKYMGEKCSGVEIIMIDRNAYKSVSVGIHLISAIQNLYPDSLQFLTSIDRLWGSNRFAAHVKSRKPADTIIRSTEGQLENYLEIIRRYKIY